MTVEGVDYAWQRPTPASLAAAGKRFACRYGGPGSAGKQLTPAEAAALEAVGVAIVANAEGAADGLLGGRTAGRDWATSALRHFAGCGMPADRPIYLSVDFNVTADQWLAVANALRGAGEILGPSMVGVYGGLNAVRWARRDNVAHWFWQTYAWSGGVWAAGNHIEQYRNGVPLGGGTVDFDRAHPADYGQWTPGGEMTYDEVWRTDKMRNPYSDNATNPTIQAETGMFNVMTHAWQTNTRVAELKAAVAKLQADVDELQARPPVVAGPVDPAALKAVLLDPAVLAAIAEAVADEDHRRSAA